MRSNLAGGEAFRLLFRVVANTLALVISLGASPALAQQNPQDLPDATVPQEPNESAPQAAPQSAYPTSQQVPARLTLPAGTVIQVRVSQFLSSDQNRTGDSFSAELQQPLVVDGWVVARRGQTVLGRVSLAQRAGRVRGVSQLGVELAQLVLVDGQQLPIRTQLLQTSGGTSQGRDAQAIGTTTGVGAAIGAAVGGGKGAAIGGAAGAAAGVAGVLLTRGRPTEIPPETLLTFQLEFPLAFSTERSVPAFRSVAPEDYNGGQLRRRPEHFAVAHYPPPPYWGYYPWGYYPGPFFFGFSSFHGRRGFRRW